MYKKAFEIAIVAHRNQVDKGGVDYINHPLEVAKKVHTEEEKILALLHDVIEDSDFTIKDLRKFGFSETILTALNILTKVKGQTYEEYLDKIIKNTLALKVKVADLEHNSDLSRILNPTQKDIKRQEKYLKAIKKLKKHI